MLIKTEKYKINLIYLLVYKQRKIILFVHGYIIKDRIFTHTDNFYKNVFSIYIYISYLNYLVLKK